MTLKCALADLPAGGAKLVLLDRPELDLEGAYRFLGRAIERLGGRYYSGPDVGTTERELTWVAEHTRFVTRPGPEGPGELAEATCAGVIAGIEAALVRLDGEAGDTAHDPGQGGKSERVAGVTPARGRALARLGNRPRARGAASRARSTSTGARRATDPPRSCACAHGARGIVRPSLMACAAASPLAPPTACSPTPDGDRLHEGAAALRARLRDNSGP
jgi:hypothetical protein